MSRFFLTILVHWLVLRMKVTTKPINLGELLHNAMNICHVLNKVSLLAAIIFLFSLAHAQYPQVLWWYDLSAPSFGSAAVGDIDNDGMLEIVFGTYFNDEHIYALNAEDGSLLWSYNTGGCNDASPAIADVDGDDSLEVIVPASSPYHVYCFKGTNGAIEWDVSAGYPNCIDSPPAVADVDNDGRPEVILGAWYGHVFALNGEDGSISWHVNVGTNSYIQSGPNILDLDNDGDFDVFVAQWSGDYRVFALDGGDGSTIWYSDVPQDHMYHGGSFADIDEDGRPEIAIGCYDNHVYVFNDDSTLLWSSVASYYVGAPTSIADLNNDEHLEIIFVSYNQLRVLSHTGTSLLWSHSTGGNIFRGAAVADMDGDGILDVVFGSDDGILRVLRGSDGQTVWTIDLEAHYGQTYEMDHAPVIADFDNDGKLDVFIIGGYGTSSQPQNNHGRAYALSGGDGTGPGWTMFRHDLRHSGCFHGPWTGIEENKNTERVAADLGSIHCMPNPFTIGTRIAFTNPASTSTTLKIYDSMGTLVKTFTSEPCAGHQVLHWNRVDDRGEKLPPGVYVLKIESGALRGTRKLIVIE
jgi:outer membrane protein assembly factor BamB